MKKVELKLEVEQVIQHSFDINLEVDDDLDIDDLDLYAYNDPNDVYGNNIYELISDHAHEMVYNEKSYIKSDELETPKVRETTLLSASDDLNEKYIVLRDYSPCTDSHCDQQLKKGDIITLLRYDEENDPIFKTSDGFIFYVFDEAIKNLFAPFSEEDPLEKLGFEPNGGIDFIDKYIRKDRKK